MFSKLILLFGLACVARAACRLPKASLESDKEYRISALGPRSGLYHTDTAVKVGTSPDLGGKIAWKSEPTDFFKVEPQQNGTYVVKSVEQSATYATSRPSEVQKIEDRYLEFKPPVAYKNIAFTSDGPGMAFDFKPIKSGDEKHPDSKCFNIVHSQTGLAWTVALPPNWFDPTVQLIRFDAKNKNQQFCFY